MDEELGRLNDSTHWNAVKLSINQVLGKLGPEAHIQAIDLSESPLPISTLLACTIPLIVFLSPYLINCFIN